VIVLDWTEVEDTECVRIEKEQEQTNDDDCYNSHDVDVYLCCSFILMRIKLCPHLG
jgi:hypothetical protein